jgi:hypothetical protein
MDVKLAKKTWELLSLTKGKKKMDWKMGVFSKIYRTWISLKI